MGIDLSHFGVGHVIIIVLLVVGYLWIAGRKKK